MKHADYPQWVGWPGNRPAIIAEVGMNHGGDKDLAWEMIESASDNGADFVKIQSFTTESFADILAEARKYRLNLILANQYLGQLEQGIRDAVLANVGTIVVFRVGPEDA